MIDRAMKFSCLFGSIIIFVATNLARGQSYEDIYIIRPNGLSALHYFSMRSPSGDIANYLKNKDELDSLLYLFPNDYQLTEYHGELRADFPEPGYALINYWPISDEQNNFTLTCDINSWHEGPFARGAVVVVFPSDFELIPMKRMSKANGSLTGMS